MMAALTTAVMAACVLLPAQAPKLYTSPLRLDQAPAHYRVGDVCTQVHESTHWANSQLRLRHRGGGYYVTGGQFLWVPQTLTQPTLGQIAQRIRYRGRMFDLYLQQARHPLRPQPMGPGMLLKGHDDDPLFLFDELAAYTNGAAEAMRYPGQGYADRVQGALEMAHYAAVCYHSIPASYAHREELRRIWLYQAARVDALARQAQQTGRQYQRQQDGWHAELVRETARLEGP